MPDIYTHIINGTESIKGIRNDVRDIIQNSLNLFYLGCMGPDIFLYHTLSPLRKSKLVISLGGKIHREHCGEFIAEALKYSKQTRFSSKIDESSIYFLGYLCHYSTDRAAHPYILCRSGKYEKHNAETRKYRTSHKVMELSIDCHMAELFSDSEIWKIRMCNYIDVGHCIPPPVQNVYHHVFGIFFGEQTQRLDNDFIDQSYRCFRKAWNFFYDPFHIKKSMLRILGLDFLLYPKNPYIRDYMNEKGEEWADPCSNKPDCRTFIEIFNDSVNLSVRLLNTAIGYLYDEISFEEMKRMIGNFSYLTNTDVTAGTSEIKHFRPIF